MNHLDRELLRVKVAAPLAGCASSCEVFLEEVEYKFATTPAKLVTVEDLERVHIYSQISFQIVYISWAWNI